MYNEYLFLKLDQEFRVHQYGYSRQSWDAEEAESCTTGPSLISSCPLDTSICFPGDLPTVRTPEETPSSPLTVPAFYELSSLLKLPFSSWLGISKSSVSFPFWVPLAVQRHPWSFLLFLPNSFVNTWTRLHLLKHGLLNSFLICFCTVDPFEYHRLIDPEVPF